MNSLECYVCDNQDGNTEKCTKTIKTCEVEQDRCLSTIVWSTTPYWTQVTNQGPVFRSRDLNLPIRAQYSGHVTCIDQSGPSIQVT